MASKHPTTTLFSLPTELRLQILEYVFTPSEPLFTRSPKGTLILDDTYSASENLQPLLTNKQLYHESNLLAFSKTPFLARNLFSNIPQRLSILHPKQVAAIRKIAFVADERQFRKLSTWEGKPFGVEGLKLETLTIVLHRSSFWHYLFDFTASIVHLLRNLQNVKRFVILRNDALVKGSLKTWYNRLVGLILKEDHRNRYDVSPPRVEKTWWGWEFDEEGQRILLEVKEGRREQVEEKEYLKGVLPLMEKLRESVEGEEWNPDPRARRHYY